MEAFASRVLFSVPVTAMFGRTAIFIALMYKLQLEFPAKLTAEIFVFLFEYKKYQTNYINLFYNLKKKIPERNILSRILWSSRQIPLRDSQQNILNGGSCGWLFTGQSNDQLLLQFGRSSPGSSFLGELRFASFTDSDINLQESRPVLHVVQGAVSPRMLVEQQCLLA